MPLNAGASVLLIGATGSVGRLIPAVAAAHGLQIRAMVRDLDRGSRLLPGVELVRGDLEDDASLADAVRGVDAIVLAQGVSAGGTPERIDYQGTRRVLAAVGTARPRLAVMTALYVTRRDHFLNEQFDQVLDWRRRAERLVRASGLPYTIVRPGWFDQVAPGDDRIVLEQGDTADAGVGRQQIAEVLVQSLLTETALRTTFELTAAAGSPPGDWGTLFGLLRKDAPGALDAPLDQPTMPLNDEPAAVQHDLDTLHA